MTKVAYSTKDQGRQAGAEEVLVRRIACELSKWEDGENDELYSDFAKRLIRLVRAEYGREQHVGVRDGIASTVHDDYNEA